MPFRKWRNRGPSLYLLVVARQVSAVGKNTYPIFRQACSRLRRKQSNVALSAQHRQLQSHLAFEGAIGMSRQPHLGHAPRSEKSNQLIRTQARAGLQTARGHRTCLFGEAAANQSWPSSAPHWNAVATANHRLTGIVQNLRKHCLLTGGIACQRRCFAVNTTKKPRQLCRCFTYQTLT